MIRCDMQHLVQLEQCRVAVAALLGDARAQEIHSRIVIRSGAERVQPVIRGVALTRFEFTFRHPQHCQRVFRCQRKRAQERTLGRSRRVIVQIELALDYPQSGVVVLRRQQPFQLCPRGASVASRELSLQQPTPGILMIGVLA